MSDSNDSNTWLRIIAVLGGFFVIYFILGFWVNTESRIPTWLIDLLIFSLSSVLWLVFFAQFIAPIRSLSERKEILKRLYHYLLQSHGPTIFIENGQVRKANHKNNRKGPGIVWLDSASAVVLRTATSFLPPKGPGLTFTEKGQYIAATVDLHTLRQTIGPKPGTNPLKITKENPDYDEIQKQRWETSGLTRDGIELIASFNVLFKVDADFGQGGTPFGYNPESVFKVVRDSQVAGSSSSNPIWNPLIAKMVVDVWRDYLRKYKLSELFEIKEGSNQTTLQEILHHLNMQLKKELVVELDEFGTPTGSDVTSNEFQKIKQMGWRVVGVNLTGLHFSDEIEERLSTQWTTTWLKNAEKERERVDRNRKYQEVLGQYEALKEFALSSCQELSGEPPESKAHALEMLVHSTFRGVIKNSDLMRRTNTETRDLLEISRWLHDKRGTTNDSY